MNWQANFDQNWNITKNQSRRLVRVGSNVMRAPIALIGATRFQAAVFRRTTALGLLSTLWVGALIARM